LESGALSSTLEAIHAPFTRRPRQDRSRLSLCGPKTADYLEQVGIDSFDALADADAELLRDAVNLSLGRPHINAMGVRAFQNAIDAAKAVRRAGEH
jgi:hypothetical protein